MPFLCDLFKSQTVEQVRKLFIFLKMTRVNLWIIAASIFLAICFSLTALYAVYLLFPLTHGIIDADFSHVSRLWGVRHIIGLFPDIFAHSVRLFILLVLWIYLVTVVKNIFHYFSLLAAQTQARVATIRLRQLLLEKMMSLSKSFYDQHSLAYLQNILTRSTVLIETRCRLAQEFITEMLLIACYVFVMMQISWKLTLVMVLILPVLALATKVLSQRVRDVSLQQNRTAANLNDRIFNLLYCMPVIKSFTRENDELSRFADLSKDEIGQSFRMQRLSSLMVPIEDVAAMTGNLCIAFAMALILKADNQLGAANIFVFFYLAMKTIPGLNAFNRFRLGIANTSAAFDDMERILYLKDRFVVKEGEECIRDSVKEIEFKGVSFTYPGKKESVLEDISITLKKGEVTAIVGPSGSGKSTLVNLLLRFYEIDKGHMCIDGKDISRYELASLRSKIAYVGQEVLLFNDTVRNNIRYGSKDNLLKEDVEELMRAVHIDEFIRKLPDGYETMVGDRGSRLSGGERQRIALARAVIKMRESDVLVLDEATSALDASAEALITEAVLQQAKNKIVLIVAHRLSTIKHADRVICLDKGRIVEIGSIQELVDKKGLFYRQWTAQKVVL